MPTAFPDVLLPDVLDFLELEWLLLCAMPVSRFWRNEAIGHPTYWRDIIACDGLDGRIEYVQAVDVFLLRISRSHDLPISVTLNLDDPSPVLESVAQHIHHIRDLKLLTSIPQGGKVLETLRRSPAPILENLTLRFLLDINFRPPRIMPHDLFAAHTPALTIAHLENIALTSSEFPPCLSSVTTLTVHISNMFADASLRRLPNVLEHCPDLVSLSIGGSILLDHAVEQTEKGQGGPRRVLTDGNGAKMRKSESAFRDTASWARLTTLALGGPCLGGWDSLRLPLGDIPSITLERADANGIAAIAEMMGDRLSLELRSVENMWDTTVPIQAFMTRIPDATPHRVRRVDLYVPYDPPGSFPIDGITALRRAPIADALIRLVLSLHNWYDLVGSGYLVAFPALDTLVFTLERRLLGWPRPARLGCPSLRRLVLRAQPDANGISVAVKDVAEFVSTSLKDVALPLDLELEGTSIDGATGEYPSLIRVATLL